MNKFTRRDLELLIDQAKKDWHDVINPLEGMNRNFEPGEVLAMAYFMASLTVLNNLTGQRISDMVDIRFAQLDVSSNHE
jgi:hypothetical protein